VFCWAKEVLYEAVSKETTVELWSCAEALKPYPTVQDDAWLEHDYTTVEDHSHIYIMSVAQKGSSGPPYFSLLNNSHSFRAHALPIRTFMLHT
jgi:hypothetical protein